MSTPIACAVGSTRETPPGATRRTRVRQFLFRRDVSPPEEGPPAVTSSTPNRYSKLDWSEVDDRAVDTVRSAGHGRRAEGRQRPPGHGDEPGPGGVPDLPEADAPQPRRPALGRAATGSCCPAATPASPSTSSSTSPGYGLELDDLKALRTWGIQTPGHPEHGHTAGVETTTGPLGQGVGNAVGMAMAARRERGLFDPKPAAGESLFDHDVYRDRQRRRPRGGRQRRGVVARRSPAARQPRAAVRRQPDLDRGRHLRSRSARTSPSATRRTAGTSRTSTGPTTARATTRTSRRCSRRTRRPRPRPAGRPSSSCARSSPGRPRTLQNTGKAHGSALGADEVAATKKVLGFDPDRTFDVADEVIDAHPAGGRARQGRAGRLAGAVRRLGRQGRRPQGRSSTGCAPAPCPSGWADALPELGRRREGRRDPGRLRRRPHRDRARCCRSCGAARPTWPAPTTPRPRASRASCRPSTPARCSPATGTAASCTSASASTRWARS